jgi:hypothetical protein
VTASSDARKKRATVRRMSGNQNRFVPEKLRPSWIRPPVEPPSIHLPQRVAVAPPGRQKEERMLAGLGTAIRLNVFLKRLIPFLEKISAGAGSKKKDGKKK